jgi:hypothetical protein
MKIERTVVIATVSVIVGLGVIGVSPAFAGESSALPACSTSAYKKNCFGTLEWGRRKYVGEFKGGYPNGQGTMTYPSGRKYVGEWKYGWKHGQGVYTWASGKKYVGGWKDGKRHGEGIVTHTDGRETMGEWKFDKPWNVATFDTSGNFLFSYTNGVPQKS